MDEGFSVLTANGIKHPQPVFVDRQALTSVIRFYGGDVEAANPRGIPESVTHLVCSTVTSTVTTNEHLIHQVNF